MRRQSKLEESLSTIIENKLHATLEDFQTIGQLIKKHSISTQEEQQLLIKIIIEICHFSNNMYRSLETKANRADVREDKLPLLGALNVKNMYQIALSYYMHALAWTKFLPNSSTKKINLIYQIKDNIIKFKSLIACRDIFLEILEASKQDEIKIIHRSTFLWHWSDTILKKTTIKPNNKTSEAICYEFLKRYPAHECNILKPLQHADPESAEEVRKTINNYLKYYQPRGFFKTIAEIPDHGSIKDYSFLIYS